MELNYQMSGLPVQKIIQTTEYWNITEDKRLIDLLCGNTAFIFGYNNRDIIDSMVDVQSKIGFLRGMSNETCTENETLIKELCSRGNFEGLAWAVSGSDAVEAAIYVNDQYWISQNIHKPTVAVFNPGYHGTTYLTKIFRNEYPLTDRAVIIERTTELETLSQLENQILSNSNIGAVLMESCPWNGGLNPWSEEFWKGVRQICDSHNINFIVDDVFGGVGKLGHFFSHSRYNVQPDIVALGKSLTGGYSPLSCACVVKSIFDAVKNSWNFGHTWSPNMGGIGAATAVCELFDNYNLNKIETKLSQIGQRLIDNMLIKQYTNIGLLLQIDLIDQYPPDTLVNAGLNGLISDTNTVVICAPVIADVVYFIELETRLLKALNEI